jgi:predicted O-methyltransferase YrrM
VHYGMALDWLQNDNTSWDFVFLDADKKVYETYYDLLIPKMSKNGLLIADNVLWKGKVLNEFPDSDTKALDAFNKKVNQDDRVDNVLLPIRDGLMLIRKK